MEVTADKKMMYTEVCGVLRALGETYREKVPDEILGVIEKNKGAETIFYDMSIPLSQQRISKEALSMICFLHLKYWCINEKEKNIIRELIQKNTARVEEKKKQKYSVDVFKKEKDERKIAGCETEVTGKALIEVTEKWYEKVIRKIKRFFGRKNDG